jgi:ATP-dependent helicase HrpA
MLRPFFQQLPQAFYADRARLRNTLTRLQTRLNNGTAQEAELLAVATQLQTSLARQAQRVANIPALEFPPDLPVSSAREEIIAALQSQQVLIVAGETGSGKTTQLPKICLAAGRGINGLIGCTQPRRIAARSIAARVATELHSALGDAVGFKVRFHERVNPDSYIKLMTDGILLAELQGDRLLRAYDTIILDEAHERNLNTDFLIGYLKQILPKRPDLKLIITSATIDTARFSAHFDNAPVISVMGRSYPVEVRYRPPALAEQPDLSQVLLAAVDELGREVNGDILIFLPGERDIRESAEALRTHHPPQTEILPLYARLSAAEQNRVFQPSGKRRIILATNVAETSLTVPGIRAVIDPGLARLNRYSTRAKVQRLLVEKISRASADQRKGRCGRIGPGICVRLYSEEDYLSRAEFTPPEILRSSLAAVILKMLFLGLGEAERFPFLERPDHKRFNEGLKSLQELGALDLKRQLTALGQQLAQWPIDPRIARMVIAAQQENCLHEVLIIAAALSIQDPRERPLQAQQKADEAQRPFRDEQSDFLSFVKLWDFYQEQQKHLSKNKLRQLCQSLFLSYNRMREWQDIHQQLFVLVREHCWQPNTTPATYAQIHRALAHGLLAHVAFKQQPTPDKNRKPGQETPLRRDPGLYSGAHHLKLHIFPGSCVFKKKPKWIMAAELAETSKLYARCVADIEPEWIEQAGAHLCKRAYLEPHWEMRAGQVSAFEQVSLYGLVLVPRRKINYGPLDPVLGREIFIREALVNGAWQSKAAFFVHNQALRADIENLEEKARRHDILVDEQKIFAFYAARIPDEIYSSAAFQQWYKTLADDKFLYLCREDLIMRDEHREFPNALQVRGMDLALHYSFAPGAEDDGVSVTIPVQVLAQLPEAIFSWLVPGFLEEKVIALIRALPKALRKHFVPAPNIAAEFVHSVSPADNISLTDALAAFLQQRSGLEIPADSWRLDSLALHLHMRFVVQDHNGQTLASGRDLGVLQAQWQERSRAHFAEAPKQAWERDNLASWECGDLPEFIELNAEGVCFRAYPALCAEHGRVALRLFDDAELAHTAHRGGMLALLHQAAASDIRRLRQHVRFNQSVCQAYAPVGACEQLKEDFITALLHEIFLAEPLPRTAATFAARCQSGFAQTFKRASAAQAIVADILAEYARLPQPPSPVKSAELSQLRQLLRPQDGLSEELRAQRDNLIYPGFLQATPMTHWAHLPRYLKALRLRCERHARDPGKDARKAEQVAAFVRAYEQARGRGANVPLPAEFRWLLEEFRVSVFAQELGTAMPVSLQLFAKL